MLDKFISALTLFNDHVNESNTEITAQELAADATVKTVSSIMANSVGHTVQFKEHPNRYYIAGATLSNAITAVMEDDPDEFIQMMMNGRIKLIFNQKQSSYDGSVYTYVTAQK